MTLLKDVPIALTQGRVSFNQDVRCLHPGEEVSGEYLAYLLTASRGHLMSLVTHSGHGTGRLDSEQLLEWILPIPPKDHQDWLVAQFRPLDQGLERLADLITAKRTFKRALMQDLLTGRRRFPEFGGSLDRHMTKIGQLPAEWKAERLALHATALSARNPGRLGPDSVMGVLKGVGLQRMRDRVRANDLRRYKLLPPEGFAYNPMRLKIGSIARNGLQVGCLVSPDYVVFQTDQASLLPGFLDQIRRSRIWQNHVDVAGSGSVRVRIYFDTLSKMIIPIPPLAEQARIVSALETLDAEIATLEASLVAHESLKRGLMQRLLSGDIELPEHLAASAAVGPDHGGANDHP